MLRACQAEAPASLAKGSNVVRLNRLIPPGDARAIRLAAIAAVSAAGAAGCLGLMSGPAPGRFCSISRTSFRLPRWVTSIVPDLQRTCSSGSRRGENRSTKRFRA